MANEPARTGSSGSERAVARPGSFFQPFQQLRDEMDRVFDSFFGRAPATLSSRGPAGWDWEPFGRSRGMFMANPQIDVRESDNDYVIQAELPGIDEKDIDLLLANDVLTLRGEKKAESKEEKEGYLLNERVFGSFERSFRLPSSVEKDRVAAKFKNGVLTVTLPKSEKARNQTKKIEIGH